MKPFSLEEYLKNPNQKVVTRDGRLVKFHCTNYRGKQPIVGQIEGDNHSISFSENGRYYNDNFDSRNDLFFIPEKHEGWINLYRNEDGISWLSPNYFASKEEAEKEGKAYTCSVTTIKIEWEE